MSVRNNLMACPQCGSAGGGEVPAIEGIANGVHFRMRLFYCPECDTVSFKASPLPGYDGSDLLDGWVQRALSCLASGAVERYRRQRGRGTAVRPDPPRLPWRGH